MSLHLRPSKALPLQVGTDKAVESAVEHRIYVSALEAGPVVFYHRVRLEYIGTDLASPSDIFDIAADVGELLCICLLL